MTSVDRGVQGRLHPFTLLFAFWVGMRSIILPFIASMVFFGRMREENYLWVAAVFVGFPLAFALIRYFTFTYRIENGELITKEGLLGRTERHIPLNRVQDIRIEQGVLHRLFGMADVFVETAGGRSPEASLSVLAHAQAEDLRAAVFKRELAPSAIPAQAQTNERQTIRELSFRDLVLAGLTSYRAASALGIIFVLWQFLDDLLPATMYERLARSITGWAVDWRGGVSGVEWMSVAAAVAGLLTLGMLISVIGSVVVFYGFTLSRTGEDIFRSHGLFTRLSSSLPRRRIQLLKVEETWLRRLFRLAALRADTAGGTVQPGQNPEGQRGRDVLLPVIPRTDVDALLPTFFPDLERVNGGGWQQVSRRAIRRGTIQGTLVCLLVAAVLCAVQRSWHGVWPLLLVPGVYGLNVMSHRHLGYWLGEHFCWVRSGWLSRSTHIVPIRNVQSVVIRQTPFDRRHRVATLIVDSAGQANTGGGPRIENVHWTEALQVARTLAQRAAHTRYAAR